MADEITKPWRETPLVESAALSKAAGCSQPGDITLPLTSVSHADKWFVPVLRGIGNYILARLRHVQPNPPSETDSPTKTHFYSSSGGNAGLASVYASRSLSYPCTVVVPLSTDALMISKLRAAGASDVIQHGDTWQEADTYLRQTVLKDAEARGELGIYVPPFDHPDIWTGNSTMIHEIKAQLPGGEKPDAVLCSVGGGGLFNGVVQGLHELGWDDVPVIAAETSGADSLATSLREGRHVTLAAITSQATSLGARHVSARTWEIATSQYGREMVKSVVLSDAEAAMACWRMADDERLLTELASAVNVALCYQGRERLEKILQRHLHRKSKIVVVLCGGSKVTLETIVGFKKEFGWIEKQVHGPDGDIPSDITAPNGR